MSVELAEQPRELAIYEKGAQTLQQVQEKVKTLTVTAATFQDTVETLALAKRIATVLDEERKKEGSPHYDTYKAINDKYNAVINPFKELVTKIESKLNAYNRAVKEEAERKQREYEAEQEKIKQEAERKQLEYEQEKKRLEEERQKQLREAEQKGEAPPPEAPLPPPPPVPTVPVVPPPPAPEAPRTTVQTSFGKTKIKERWSFEVLDINQVPREWLTVDEKKVQKEISREHEPVRTIAGLKIFPV